MNLAQDRQAALSSDHRSLFQMRGISLKAQEISAAEEGLFIESVSQSGSKKGRQSVSYSYFCYEASYKILWIMSGLESAY
jgi:hypothetical protein